MIPALCSLAVFVIVATSGFLNVQDSQQRYHGSTRLYSRHEVIAQTVQPEEVPTNNTCLGARKQQKMLQKSNNIVVIHAGPHKTSSSSLQKVLMEQSQNGRLGKDGYETLGQTKFTGCPPPMPQFPPSSYKNHATLTYALQEGKCSPRNNENSGPLPLQQLSDLLSSSFAHNKSVILSAEGFDKPAVNLTLLGERIHAKSNRVETLVVLYYRRLLDWLPSIYFQSHRFQDMKEPFDSFVEWLTPETLSDTLETYTWRVKERFEEHGFPNVQVLSMHSSNASSLKTDMTTQFFCDYLPHASRTCSTLQNAGSLHKIGVENQGATLEYHRIMALAHKEGLIHKRTVNNPKALRLLEERLSAKPASFKHAYRICLSEEMKGQLLDLALTYDSKMNCGSLDCWCIHKQQVKQDELQKQRRIEFKSQLDSSDKLCSWNVELLLQDETWREYLRSLDVPVS